MSTNRNTRYQRWRAGRKKKVFRHPSRFQAWKHAVRLMIINRDLSNYIYPCRYTDDYRDGWVGELHWHVGRNTGARFREESVK